MDGRMVGGQPATAVTVVPRQGQTALAPRERQAPMATAVVASRSVQGHDHRGTGGGGGGRRRRRQPWAGERRAPVWGLVLPRSLRWWSASHGEREKC